MRRVRFSRRAQHDLRSILDFLAEDSPTLADRMVDRLERASAELAESALQYPLVRNRESLGIRRRMVHPCNIFYTIEGDVVEIVHILHSARDIDRILFPED